MAQGSTRGIPIDTDNTLSANSNLLVSSQQAVKTYVDGKTIVDATPTDGSSNAVSSNGVFDAVFTTTTTGSVISFATPQVYNSIASPSTSNITNDLTGAKLGIIQKIYHNHSVAPTTPAGWVRIGGSYVVNELNIIYAEWAGSSRVEYWITQEQ